MRFILGVVLIFGSCTLASRVAQASSFEEFYDDTVLPFYWSAPHGILRRSQNVELVYKVFENPLERGAIVFVTGWTETHLKYAELIWDFYQQGYSVYTFDNRGMGFSSRLTSNAQQVHVEKVQDYVDDLRAFIEQIVRPDTHQKLYLVAHSMGGLIVAHYMAQFPKGINAAVFSAPLFELNTGKIPERIAYKITEQEIKKGKGKCYALTQGDTTFEKASDFTTQKTTHSLKRWKKKIANWREFPFLLQGGSTNQWVHAILESTFSLLKEGWKDMPIPSLVLEASEDVYVINKGHKKVCSQVSQCWLKRYSQSYHELFLEGDPVRDQVIVDTLTFLQKH